MKKIIIPIIILLLLGGGFYAYKYVYVPSQEAKYEVEETTEVETKEIAVVPYNCAYETDNEIDKETCRANDEILKVMENSDASFFEIVDENCEKYVITQVPKEEFERFYKEETEYPCDSYREELVGAVTGIKYFFNLDASTIKGSIYENVNGSNPLFGKTCVTSTLEITIRNVFDKYGGIVEYFNKHDLKLSCDDVKTIKVAEGKRTGMLTIFEAKVTTDDCKGDMSDLGIFADKGKTKTIKVKVSNSEESISAIYFK